MSEVADIANREAKRMMSDFVQCLAEGYCLLNWWDKGPEPGDTIRTFGFVALIKRHEKNKTETCKH